MAEQEERRTTRREPGRWPGGGHGVAVLLAAAAIVALAGCGGSTKAAAPSAAPPSSTSPTTAASATTVPSTATPATTPAPSSPAAPATAAPAPTTPTTTTVVGLTLSGAGTTFTPPAAPTTVPYTPACQALVDPGFYGSCVIVTSPAGTAAAIVEQQQRNYQQGQPITAGQERDLVYVKVNDDWSLRLRRTPVADGEAVTEVSSSDIMRDRDPKAVFVEPAPNSSFGNELDVVEANGTVSLYRQLHGGFASVAPAGGLTTYVPDPAGGYDVAVIDYRGGAWTIVSATMESQSQAQAEGSQPFYDPSGTQATY